MTPLFRLLLLVSAAFLGACATHNVAYDGPRRAPGEIATVRGFSQGGAVNAVSTQVIAVDGKELELANMLPNTVEVLPGNRVFLVRISSTSAFRTLSVPMEVRAGEQLEFGFAIDEATLATGAPNVPVSETFVRDLVTGERRAELTGWSELKLWIQKTTIQLYY
jgi:hypothetical protein